MDVLRFREESSGPNAVAFLKRFIRRVGRLVGGGCFLVFVVSIFDEGRERARATGFDISDFLWLGLALLSEVRATADAAAGGAPSHLDLLCDEIDLGVMFAEPSHPQYQALLAQLGDGKEDAFRVSLIGHEDVDYSVNAASFIERSIDVVHRDGRRQATRWQLSALDEFFVDEVASRAGVNHGFGVDLLERVRGFKMDRDHDTSWPSPSQIKNSQGRIPLPHPCWRVRTA